jgi:hypothetical protein
LPKTLIPMHGCNKAGGHGSKLDIRVDIMVVRFLAPIIMERGGITLNWCYHSERTLIYMHRAMGREGWGRPTPTLVPWRQGFRHPTRNECRCWSAQTGREAPVQATINKVFSGTYCFGILHKAIIVHCASFLFLLVNKGQIGCFDIIEHEHLYLVKNFSDHKRI